MRGARAEVRGEERGEARSEEATRGSVRRWQGAPVHAPVGPAAGWLPRKRAATAENTDTS